MKKLIIPLTLFSSIPAFAGTTDGFGHSHDLEGFKSREGLR